MNTNIGFANNKFSGTSNQPGRKRHPSKKEQLKETRYF